MVHHQHLHILLCVLCLSPIFHAILVWSQSPPSLMLGCGLGGAGGKDPDGREWSPDDKYLSGGDSSSFRASYQDPSLSSQVPYMTARVFTSQASYKFPVSPDKRYWLRLHFYPSIYSNFDTSISYFSVTANGATLLANFSASITCEALSQAYIDREYSLAPLNSDSLTLTFTPSDKHKGSFAFVNGIQLMQMPDLFNSSATMVGSDQLIDATGMHSQTMFRLNVGGQYISPPQDSSNMSRSWYDDTPYLYGASAGVTTEANDSVPIKYQAMPQYIAPPTVYSTSRSMGSDKDANLGYNLTWIFQVDPNSMYLTRLHFCDYTFDKVNEIVFNIYLNNETAEAGADVIAWTSERGVPTYKDYVVYSQDGVGADQLWLALHPATDLKPEYYDAILNGIEIFKLNDTSLAGPNPQPSDMLMKAQEEQQKTFQTRDQQRTRPAVIGGAAGGAALLAVLCIAVYQRQKRASGTYSQTSSWLPLYGNGNTHSSSKSTMSGRSTGGATLAATAQGLCRYFSLSEMKHATKNFDESNVIGVGGFGKVYRGVVDDGMQVAIKRSNPQSEQGVHEFQTEIEMLSKLRHKHLVSLIGFCEEDDEMCLVYDFMARGTLREHVYKANKPVNNALSWKQRLEICIGAARGLHYLHTGAKYTIIHRDVKTTNILLDENWVAKVSDFGLSKTGPNMNKGHVSTVVKGSFGYLDPEYFRRQQLTEKSDVYSFGVVLFEVLCARPALNPSLSKEQVSLADWALLNKRRGTLEDIIDPNLKGKIRQKSLRKFADTAEKCLSDHGVHRPSMNDLLWNLELALQLQENPEGSIELSDGDGEFQELSLKGSDVTNHYKNQSLGGEQETNKESGEDYNTIFSLMVNPKGR